MTLKITHKTSVHLFILYFFEYLLILRGGGEGERKRASEDMRDGEGSLSKFHTVSADPDKGLDLTSK